MINTEKFYSELLDNEVEFFAGVPDSLLKDFCRCVDDSASKEEHCITANEGSAVGLATGYHLSTGKIPLVYMQNSGLGNAINPLVSLAEESVYGIPMLLMIGWRGEPGMKDEPQHKKMGEITVSMLETLDIPFVVFDESTSNWQEQLKNIIDLTKDSSRPHALVIKKGTFSTYATNGEFSSDEFNLTREEALEAVIDCLDGDEVVVSTTGKLSRELFELRERRGEGNEKDFLTVGSMGHSSQVALGISLYSKSKKVLCLDGDGAALMHLGGWATIGEESPRNFIHILFNNGAHESVGGQKTSGFWVDFVDIAKGCKYKEVASVKTEKQIKTELNNLLNSNKGPNFLEIKINMGARSDLGRPNKTPKENKADFERYIR